MQVVGIERERRLACVIVTCRNLQFDVLIRNVFL